VNQRNWFTSNTWVVGGGTIPGPYEWAGAVDQYFGAIFLPDDPQHAAMVTFHNQIPLPNNPDPNKPVMVPVIGAAVGTPGTPTSTRIFVGPKATDVLMRNVPPTYYQPMQPLTLPRGAELGRFHMGSTVILLAPPGALTWDPALAAGQEVRLGQGIATMLK